MKVDVVVKLGGSLAEGDANPQRLMTTLVRLARRHRLLVVPGGGEFAETVRGAFARLHLSEGAAHRMALLAMDQYGLLLTDLTPGSTAVTSLAEARAVVAAGRLPVLLPSAAIWAADPLENSWRVTGDAIAAWVAGVVGARLLVMAKAVDTNGSLSALDLAGGHVVDPVFGQVLRTPCWIVNGHYPERLEHLLTYGTTTGGEVLQ